MQNNLDIEFLNLYRDLEEVLAVRAGGSKPGLVRDFADGEGRRFKEELDVFKDMRNLLSHHGEISGEPVVYPSRASVECLRKILEFAQNPPAAMNIMLKVDYIFKAAYSDKIIDIAKVMERRGFSHVPIIGDGKRLLGVFSVGTVFSLLLSEKSGIISGETTLGEIKEQIKAENHTTESFAFVSPSASLSRLREAFEHKGPEIKRVAICFVTENGKPTGKVLGMITPWDLIRAEE